MKMNLASIRRQRGAAALAVSMLLLFASSIVVFYLNRGLIFEQKTSANQMRSTTAFEVAEAGIEWATGMLNSPYDINSSCQLLATTNTPFRRLYIQTGWPANSNVAVTPITFPGCKINGTALDCRCPTPHATNETVANPGTALLPSFTVAFAAVNDPATGLPDATAVRITSTGCTAQAGMCKPLTPASAATTAASDANATVSVVLKLSPTLRAAPSAALTCGTSCQVGGSYRVVNKDVASNGYLVNAGSSITRGAGTSMETINGQPLENAVIPDDPSLSAVSSNDPTCTNSGMFKTYFGTTLEQYARSPDVKVIPGCDNPSYCGGAIHTAYEDGWRSFYFPDGMSLNNSAPFTTLGAAANGQGVNLVSPASIDINGNITINGLLFSNSAKFNDLGTGTANVNGAIISCAAYRNNGNGTLSYDAGALGGTGLRPGLMIRVPGSWRDF